MTRNTAQPERWPTARRTHSPGSRRRTSRQEGILGILRILGLIGIFGFLGIGATVGANRAFATPLENTRYGGLNRGSVVEPHPASLFRNPAVIGLLPGTHAFLDGTARLELGRIQRSPIRSSTGMPGAGADVRFPAITYAHMTPDLYFAATSDLGTRRVVLGLAIFTPYAEIQRFGDPLDHGPPTGAEPMRYHRIRSDWFHLYVAPVVAVRLHDRFRLGVGFGYARSMLRMAFGRDCGIRACRGGLAAAPPYEASRWLERVAVTGTENSFFFNLGFLLRLPKHVDVGAAYRSKVVTADRENVLAEGSSDVRLYDESTGGWSRITGRARIQYELPDSVAVGVKWRHKKWDFAAGFEWVHWSVHKEIKFTLSGSDFSTADMSNFDVRFTRFRGFEDVYRVSFLAGYRVRKLHLSFGGLYESSAVPARWLNAAAVDAHKADLLVALEWRVHRRVGLYVGYSVTLAPEVSSSPSGFRPSDATGCLADQVDILWSESCRRVMEGKALPSAAGRYWQMVHRLGVGISFDYE